MMTAFPASESEHILNMRLTHPLPDCRVLAPGARGWLRNSKTGFTVSDLTLPIRITYRIVHTAPLEDEVDCLGCLRWRRALSRNMSRIFDALKHAQSERKGHVQQDAPADGGFPDRRRSPRSPLDISVYVYGHGPDTEPFHEEAHTLNVNATGALLLLSVPVETGQELLLTNDLTQKEQDCRVVFLGTRRSRTVEAGIAFPRINPGFWKPPAETEVTPDQP